MGGSRVNVSSVLMTRVPTLENQSKGGDDSPGLCFAARPHTGTPSARQVCRPARRQPAIASGTSPLLLALINAHFELAGFC